MLRPLKEFSSRLFYIFSMFQAGKNLLSTPMQSVKQWMGFFSLANISALKFGLDFSIWLQYNLSSFGNTYLHS